MVAAPERLRPATKQKHEGIIAMEKSSNAKIGDASATYVAQTSCPKSCPFYNAGCYAELGFVGIQTRRINRESDSLGLSPLELAVEEAQSIDELTGQRPLRLHVVGDSTTDRGTRLIAAAARRYIAQFGQAVWSYTHAWRKVSRAAWGAVSILASCESIPDIRRARMRGYATAIVVPEHPSDRLYELEGEKLLPCPEQTRGVTCVECRLCMRDDYLRESNITIAFAAHGSKRRMVKEKIT